MQLNTSLSLDGVTMYLKEEEKPTFEGLNQVGEHFLILKQGESRVSLNFQDINTLRRFVKVNVEFLENTDKHIADEISRSTRDSGIHD